METTLFLPFSNSSEPALIDCGAMGLYIDHDVVKRLNLPTKKLAIPIKIRNVDNSENIAGKLRETVTLQFETCDRMMTAVFYVTQLGDQGILLGLPWLEAENPDIDWKARTLRWRDDNKRNIYALINQEKLETTNDLTISFIRGVATQETRKQWKGSPIENTPLFKPIDEEDNPFAYPYQDYYPPEQEDQRLEWTKSKMNKAMLLAYEQEKSKLKEMKTKTLEELVPKELHKYLKVFSEQKSNRLPSHTSYDHKIDLKEDFKPEASKIYRIDPANEEAFNKFIDENLEKGYIRKPEKDSPQAAGFFFVPKKDGRQRPCQDYRVLNSYTVRNPYPLPRIDELVDSLHGKTLFTKMDVRWGYNNIRIREGDEWKAAFICKRGIFEPTVMFFGLTNSPATFQSMMDTIFKVQIAQGWLKIYMDDILIANEGDRDDMTQKILIVLQILEENDLFIKPEKCLFYVTSVDFLGFIIEDGKSAWIPGSSKA
jgi:hypothetical protein